MDNYCELTIQVQDEPLRELLIAGLSEIGYEGFEESDTFLKAYIKEDFFSPDDINILLNKYSLTYSKSIINKQNWNKLWESNFEPVQVDDFVGIRADFHPSFTNTTYEIIITPKMSFGTGHHATTYMVMQLMRELDFTGKVVLDFGTGTAILAILAEKLGATEILGIDNDDWCIENASENISINQCKYIDIDKVDKIISNKRFDIILANINRNIILDNMHGLRNSLAENGLLLLSGLLKEDEADIVAAFTGLGLKHKETRERNGWIALWLFC